MDIGKLRHRIELQEKTTGRDSFGSEVEQWNTKATVWASVEPIAGREYFLAQQVQSEVTHRIRIRYYAGLQSDWRIRFGTKLFDILSIIDFEERHVEMQIMCKEFVT